MNPVCRPFVGNFRRGFIHSQRRSPYIAQVYLSPRSYHSFSPDSGDLRRVALRLDPPFGSVLARSRFHFYRFNDRRGQSSPSPISLRSLSVSKKNDSGTDGPSKHLSSLETSTLSDSEEYRTGDISASTDLVYFPWRHSLTPLERIVEEDDLSGMPNNSRSRLFRKFIAARELNISFWGAVPMPFYTHEWELKLADNFSMAFRMSLEELLFSLFQAPVKNEDDMISIDTSERKRHDESSELENSIESLSSSNNDRRLNLMIDKHLANHYQTVNPNTLQLKLSIRPIEAKLQHIFVIPMLTRSIVADKPHLKGGYQRIETAFQETGSVSKVKEMTYEIANDIGFSRKRTVVAEAAIKCMEFFQVIDLRNGEVVQGMQDGDDEEEVVHLVRFEVVTDRNEDGEGRKLGHWKIIDWDDLLDGNVFY